jgi:chorismate dehydratase
MKIAVTDFLNAKPLIQGFKELDVDLIFEVPRNCSQILESGKVDFALIPSIEYARIKDVSIVPGISISSVGPVKSVLLFLKKEISKIRKIALDPRSRTAVTLLKILTRDFYKITPQFFESTELLKTLSAVEDAALLIGDRALKAVEGFKGSVIDLGQVWNEWTQLPFTYAFWAGRHMHSDFLSKFYEAKERGMFLRPQIAREFVVEDLNENLILDYLTRNICYDWSSDHEKGLKLFYELAFRNSLVEEVPELRFFRDRQKSPCC